MYGGKQCRQSNNLGKTTFIFPIFTSDDSKGLLPRAMQLEDLKLHLMSRVASPRGSNCSPTHMEQVSHLISVCFYLFTEHCHEKNMPAYETDPVFICW